MLDRAKSLDQPQGLCYADLNHAFGLVWRCLNFASLGWRKWPAEWRMNMAQQPASEKELLRLQIQAYEFYAGLIDRAVTNGAHEAIMPKWDEQRAVEYKQLADQLRQRLAELEQQDTQAASTTAPTS